MSNEINCYLTLEKEGFEKTKKRAEDSWKEVNPNEDEKYMEYHHGDAKLVVDELYLDEDTDAITINGKIWSFNQELGWIDLDIPLDQEIIIDIIQRWMKRLGKLKTVLEATK